MVHWFVLSLGSFIQCGPSGSGKSWLLGHALHEVAYENGLRIVFFPSTEMRSLGQLLEELGRYWKTRFALVMDDPFSRVSMQASPVCEPFTFFLSF